MPSRTLPATRGCALTLRWGRALATWARPDTAGADVSPKALIFWSIFLGGVVLDQVTKIWVYTQLEYRVDEIQLIPGFLSIVHAQNPGAAFSILSDFEYRHYVFLGFTVVAGVIIADMYRKLPRTDRLLSAALGLILSGAVGNAIDRVHKQTVTDFVRVYTESPGLKAWLIDMFGTNEWPAFNVADSALLIGVVIFLLHSLFSDGGDDTDGAEGAAPSRSPATPPEA